MLCGEISHWSLHSVDWYSTEWRLEQCSCNMLLITNYCRHEVINGWPDLLMSDCIPSQLVHDQLEDFSPAEYHQQTNINILDWIVQCFTSPPTQYRLYGRQFLHVKRPNQQYQRTEGSYKGKQKQHKEYNTPRNTK